VNSAWSTPIFNRTHSSASTEPVSIAVKGMSPSLLLRGMWMSPATFAVHCVMLKVTCRLQRPSWMTTGTLLPYGTFVSVKVPSAAVVAAAMGVPVTSALQDAAHWTPCENGCTAVFGT
jgi:hypothetical protein